MFAALLGVASFHRACLLAQDFTHEPACQTGERAPQGRFRHQPEQMVHPPFAWQLASFPSLPVCGEEAPYMPLAGLRHPTDILPGNQGTASPFCLPPSVSGTGRAHRVERPELSGSVPPGIRWPNQLSLWRCWPLERRVRRAARGWNTRNMGRAFLSAPKPRWRSGAVRFTGLLERRAESMDE